MTTGRDRMAGRLVHEGEDGEPAGRTADPDGSGAFCGTCGQQWPGDGDDAGDSKRHRSRFDECAAWGSSVMDGFAAWWDQHRVQVASEAVLDLPSVLGDAGVQAWRAGVAWERDRVRGLLLKLAAAAERRGDGPGRDQMADTAALLEVSAHEDGGR